MTGLDLSGASLAQARRLAEATATDIDFVESDVYAAPAALGRTFDLVYVSLGALSWLPSIDRGPRSSTPCCVPVDGSSSVTSTRCSTPSRRTGSRGGSP